MPNFQDASGRLWRLDLSDDNVAAVKARTGVDLHQRQVLDVSTAEQVGLVGRVLWVLLQGQAEARGIEPENLPTSLGSDGVIRAYRTLGEEILRRKAVVL